MPANQISFHSIVVKVGFQQELYHVNESDGSVEVCTILCGEIEREVTLNLSKTQGTGTGIILA